MTGEDVAHLVARFAEAAERARRAGFDGVELHAGHGYILSEFLSPASNRREDVYGGPIENRARFLVETIRAVKERVGDDFPVWCRIDGCEYRTRGGITPEDAQHAAELAEAAGADAIHVSAYADSTEGAAFTEAPLVHQPCGFVPHAEGVKKRVGVPVIAVGRIEPEEAEALLVRGGADFIAMARKLLADPQLARKLTEGRRADIRPCIYCYTCVGRIFLNQESACAVNARSGREFEIGGRRTWYGDEDAWHNRISLGLEWTNEEDQNGQPLERETELSFNITGPRQLFIGAWPAQRTRVFDGRSFEQEVLNAYIEMSPNGSLFFSLFAGGGDAIDFAETRPAEVLFVEPSVRYNFGRRIKASLSHNLQQLDIDEGRLFEANLTQLRLVYQFNQRTFVRSISQYRTVDRNQALFTDDVEQRTESLLTHLLFSYKVNPQTVFFLGYSDTRRGDDITGLTQSDRAIFTKFGYAWVM